MLLQASVSIAVLGYGSGWPLAFLFINVPMIAQTCIIALFEFLIADPTATVQGKDTCILVPLLTKCADELG